MQIIHDFLTINEYSRPGKKLREVLALVIHWTAAPEQNAAQVRAFFESKKTGAGGYGSAHYIIDQTGLIIAAVPEWEVAYHAGSSQPDPESGKIYTDHAREILGQYATETNSPNNSTLSIELCPIDAAGNFSGATYDAAVELAADICARYALNPEKRIMTHKQIVGWKDCPRNWTDRNVSNFSKNVYFRMRK